MGDPFRFLAFCVQVFHLAATVSTSDVEVTLPAAGGMFECAAPPKLGVTFHEFVAYTSNGTAVSFKRKWTSQASYLKLAAKKMELTAESTFVQCANVVASNGGDGFTYEDGVCSKLELLQDFSCKEAVDIHVYVSELFKSRPVLQLAPLQYPGKEFFKRKVKPILPEILKAVQLNPVDGPPNIEPGVRAFYGKDKKLYYFPAEMLDVETCASNDVSDLDVYYASPDKTVLYLSDFCGAKIDRYTNYFEKYSMVSHRGFGCEYFPAEVKNGDCMVEISLVAGKFELAVNDFVGEDACDGFTLELHDNSNGNKIDLCKTRLSSANHSQNITLRLAGSSKNKRQKLGFVFAFDYTG